MFFDRILASKQDRNLVVAFYRWPSFLHVNIRSRYTYQPLYYLKYPLLRLYRTKPRIQDEINEKIKVALSLCFAILQTFRK